ncbi:DUF1624 domain-containing protein [Candidatus Sumerlaeota bacterium]|nr:DUF1624 domain-containing protein [Candidatus Sumerlaeota bacterium]
MTSTSLGEPLTPPRPRYGSFDVMRGLAMVSMALSHCQMYWYVWDDSAHFAQRWITHWTQLATPTFLSLAGMMMAVAAFRRAERGRSLTSTRWFYVRRGLWLILLDQIWMKIWFEGWGACWGNFWPRVAHGPSEWRPLGLHWFLWAVLLGAAAISGSAIASGMRRGADRERPLRFWALRLAPVAVALGVLGVWQMIAPEPVPWLKCTQANLMRWGILSCTGSAMIIAAVIFRLPAVVLVVIGWALLRWAAPLGDACDRFLALWPEGERGIPLQILAQLRRVCFEGQGAGYPTVTWMGFLIQGLGFGRIFHARHQRGKPIWPVFLGMALFLLTWFFINRVQVAIQAHAVGKKPLGETSLQAMLHALLHAEKFPRSWDYTLGMGGFIFLLLGLLSLHGVDGSPRNPLFHVLQVCGRVPLFFYLIHLPLITGPILFLHVPHELSLLSAALYWVAVLVILYPLCRLYHWLKRSRSQWWWLHYL